MGRLKNEITKLDKLTRVISTIFQGIPNKHRKAMNLLTKILEMIYRNKYNSVNDTILKSILCEERVNPEYVPPRVILEIVHHVNEFVKSTDIEYLPVLIVYLKVKYFLDNIFKEVSF